MSQHEPRWDRTLALRGFGRRGQIYDTDRGSGPGARVMKLHPWAARVTERVVHDFTRDALTVANLRHPHVVQVEDAGRLPDGTPFVVMERLRGKTLEEVIAAGPIPLSELLPTLQGVASALSAAHAAGVAHGELRADNVFMAEVPGYAIGFPKLLDFGVARLATAARNLGRETNEPPVGVDAHTDRRALATLAHQLITRGRVLDEARVRSADRVLARAAGTEPEPPFETAASLLEALRQALTAPAPPTLPAPPSPPPVPEPASLTQQFFAEGDKHEQEQEQAHEPTHADDEVVADTEVELDRVPRSRAQMFAVASLAVVSAAVMTWTIVALSGNREPAAPTSPPRPAEVALSPPMSSPPPAPVQARAPLRRVRVANASTHRTPPRTEPSSFTAPASPAAPSPPESAPAAATPATPAAPFDEDVTQPWEQTDPESTDVPAAPDPPSTP